LPGFFPLRADMCRFGLHFRDLYVGGGPGDASDG
jgi:hypothetical protein